ncbi:hypothetical protein KFL_003750060 [Klebsormidium nitens]|uniref:Orc1-like AAA ATPase domain-containing protein n=1 Tax=Klebsormidium nitens TaxID=105231 RepID=A0A1Y1IG68_KLENI|nr:hypothetical protein KFL_003750060 [Klebsormidium nitens]|eukprot:GAQ87756.1 hypothetical protein KFL_003750060 [Klebsormidium nitens]
MDPGPRCQEEYETAERDLPYFNGGIPPEKHWGSQTLDDLKRWIGPDGQGRIVCLASMTGWGKTSVVERAAKETGAIFISVPGVANGFLDRMRAESLRTTRLALEKAEHVSVRALLEELEAVVKTKVWTLMTNVAAVINKSPSQAVFKLNDKTDYYRFSPVSEPLPLDLPVHARVVLLLDNLEFLGSTWRTPAVDLNDVAVKGHWAAYVSTLLSAAVTETCKLNPQLRVAFALTLKEFSHRLVLHESALLFPIAKLTLPSSEQVESVLRAYLEGQVESGADLGKYAKTLVGPPRILQRFLQGVWPSGAETVLQTTMESFIERVRDAHWTEVYGSLNLTGLRNKTLLKALCELWNDLKAAQKSVGQSGSDVFPLLGRD